jgi:hypothetical protein
MSNRIRACGAAILLLLAAPATARAVPAMEPLKPCYVTADTAAGPQSEPVQITATGFTPNSDVQVAIDGVLEPATAKAGLAGELSFALAAPFIESGSRSFTVTLTEVGNPANTVSATAQTTALGVRVRPRAAAPSDRVRFTGSGFTRNKAIYAHYVYKGKVRKTVRMARRPGRCGSFRARRRQIPIRAPGLGDWTIQFDQKRRFVDPAVTPIVFVRLGLRIRLVPD